MHFPLFNIQRPTSNSHLQRATYRPFPVFESSTMSSFPSLSPPVNGRLSPSSTPPIFPFPIPLLPPPTSSFSQHHYPLPPTTDALHTLPGYTSTIHLVPSAYPRSYQASFAPNHPTAQESYPPAPAVETREQRNERIEKQTDELIKVDFEAVAKGQRGEEHGWEKTSTEGGVAAAESLVRRFRKNNKTPKMRSAAPVEEMTMVMVRVGSSIRMGTRLMDPNSQLDPLQICCGAWTLIMFEPFRHPQGHANGLPAEVRSTCVRIVEMMTTMQIVFQIFGHDQYFLGWNARSTFSNVFCVSWPGQIDLRANLSRLMLRSGRAFRIGFCPYSTC